MKLFFRFLNGIVLKLLITLHFDFLREPHSAVLCTPTSAAHLASWLFQQSPASFKVFGNISFVGALNSIVDQIFIANADYLGSCGNAANTLVFPLTVIASLVLTAIYLLFSDKIIAMLLQLLSKAKDDAAI